MKVLFFLLYASISITVPQELPGTTNIAVYIENPNVLNLAQKIRILSDPNYLKKSHGEATEADRKKLISSIYSNSSDSLKLRLYIAADHNDSIIFKFNDSSKLVINIDTNTSVILQQELKIPIENGNSITITYRFSDYKFKHTFSTKISHVYYGFFPLSDSLVRREPIITYYNFIDASKSMDSLFFEASKEFAKVNRNFFAKSLISGNGPNYSISSTNITNFEQLFWQIKDKIQHHITFNSEITFFRIFTDGLHDTTEDVIPLEPDDSIRSAIITSFNSLMDYIWSANKNTSFCFFMFNFVKPSDSRLNRYFNEYINGVWNKIAEINDFFAIDFFHKYYIIISDTNPDKSFYENFYVMDTITSKELISEKLQIINFTFKDLVLAIKLFKISPFRMVIPIYRLGVADLKSMSNNANKVCRVINKDRINIDIDLTADNLPDSISLFQIDSKRDCYLKIEKVSQQDSLIQHKMLHFFKINEFELKTAGSNNLKLLMWKVPDTRGFLDPDTGNLLSIPTSNFHGVFRVKVRAAILKENFRKKEFPYKIVILEKQDIVVPKDAIILLIFAVIFSILYGFTRNKRISNAIEKIRIKIKGHEFEIKPWLSELASVLTIYLISLVNIFPAKLPIISSHSTRIIKWGSFGFILVIFGGITLILSESSIINELKNKRPPWILILTNLIMSVVLLGLWEWLISLSLILAGIIFLSILNRIF